MKLLFISSLYPKEYIEELKALARGLLQNASDVFQWAIVDGLVRCGVDFEVACLPSLPAYPLRYGKLYTPKGDVCYEDMKIGKMLGYCDLVVYKTISMRYHLQKHIIEWIRRNTPELYKGELVVFVYTPYVPYIDAIRRVKRIYPRIKVVAIVTDLVDDMLNFASNRTFLKQIQCGLELRKTKKLYRYIDKFVLLTKHMEEKIPEAIGANIVIEGIFAPVDYHVPIKKENVRTLLYTGTFEEFAGVRDLVESFMQTKNKNFRLQLCGNGELVDYVKKQALKDSRIQYLGVVSHDEARRLQGEATLLINPRKPDEGITRYSFPSKTMEYLSSGTPMIGYKLEGIPMEYYEYMYTTDDLSIPGLSVLINSKLILPQSVLDEKAMRARMFILTNKTSEIQVRKILDFIG